MGCITIPIHPGQDPSSALSLLSCLTFFQEALDFIGQMLLTRDLVTCDVTRAKGGDPEVTYGILSAARIPLRRAVPSVSLRLAS